MIFGHIQPVNVRRCGDIYDIFNFWSYSPVKVCCCQFSVMFKQIKFLGFGHIQTNFRSSLFSQVIKPHFSRHFNHFYLSFFLFFFLSFVLSFMLLAFFCWYFKFFLRQFLIKRLFPVSSLFKLKLHKKGNKNQFQWWLFHSFLLLIQFKIVCQAHSSGRTSSNNRKDESSHYSRTDPC